MHLSTIAALAGLSKEAKVTLSIEELEAIASNLAAQQIASRTADNTNIQPIIQLQSALSQLASMVGEVSTRLKALEDRVTPIPELVLHNLNEPRLTSDTVNRIISLHNEGVTVHAIAEHLELDADEVARIVGEFIKGAHVAAQPEPVNKERKTYLDRINELREKRFTYQEVCDTIEKETGQKLAPNKALTWFKDGERGDPTPSSLILYGEPIRKIMRKGNKRGPYKSRSNGKPSLDRRAAAMAPITPGKERKEYALPCVMLAAGDTQMDIITACEITPVEIGTIKRKYFHHIEEIKKTPPGPARWAYLQTHFGLGMSDREEMQERLGRLGMAMREAGFQLSGPAS